MTAGWNTESEIYWIRSLANRDCKKILQTLAYYVHRRNWSGPGMNVDTERVCEAIEAGLALIKEREFPVTA